MFKPTATLIRQQEIRGVSIPAFINNTSYYFNEFIIYEDGWIDFWGLKELDELRKNLADRWVTVDMPDNDVIKIHGLGYWTIQNSEWAFTRKTFIEYVISLIKEMNPEWAKTYKYIEKDKRINGLSRVVRKIIYKEHQRTRFGYPDRYHGDGTNMFYKIGDEYWLVTVIVYANAHTCISRLETPVNISFFELEALMVEGIVLTELPQNARVNIYGLGSFHAQDGKFVVRIDDKLQELKDYMRVANNLPSSLDETRTALEDYDVSPTAENKARLKAAYESIPDHEKRYVGGMDDKDHRVRSILYRKS